MGTSDSKSFQPLVEQLGEISKDGDETVLREPVSLNDILPGRTSSFYRYSGSLTTPNCQQIVIWTIFDNPIEISEQQVFQVKEELHISFGQNWSHENLFDIFFWFVKVYRDGDCWNQSRVLYSPWLIDLVRVFFFFFLILWIQNNFQGFITSESNTTTLLLCDCSWTNSDICSATTVQIWSTTSVRPCPWTDAPSFTDRSLDVKFPDLGPSRPHLSQKLTSGANAWWASLTSRSLRPCKSHNKQ